MDIFPSSTVREMKEFAAIHKLDGINLATGGPSKRTKEDLYRDISQAFAEQRGHRGDEKIQTSASKPASAVPNALFNLASDRVRKQVGETGRTDDIIDLLWQEFAKLSTFQRDEDEEDTTRNRAAPAAEPTTTSTDSKEPESPASNTEWIDAFSDSDSEVETEVPQAPPPPPYTFESQQQPPQGKTEPPVSTSDEQHLARALAKEATDAYVYELPSNPTTYFALLDRATRLDPGNGDYPAIRKHLVTMMELKEEGNDSFRQGDYVWASEMYKEFLSNDYNGIPAFRPTPNAVRVQVLSNLGLAEFKMKQFSASRDYITAGLQCHAELCAARNHLRTEPSHLALREKLYMRRGMALMALENPSDARLDFEEAIASRVGAP
ncbi:hypothetical protein HKX48_008972, partial [Thoreauomyces humboldtii]